MGRTKTIDDAELLQFAREVFREHGHTAATRDIARAAGVTQAVLYQRFGSKDELFLRAMAPEMPDLDALLGPYPPRDAKVDLVRIAERLVEFFASHMPTLLHVLAHPELRPAQLQKWHAHLPFAPIVRALAARIQKLQADGMIRKANAEATARAIVSAVHTSAFLQTMLGHGGSQLTSIIEVLWHGLDPER